MANLIERIKTAPRIAVIISIYVLISIFIIVVAIIIGSTSSSNTIKINNYQDIVKNLSGQEYDSILGILEYTLSLNTSTPASEIKDISIRENSYRQDYVDNIYSTLFIVDIPSLQQSYQIVDRYSRSGLAGDYNIQTRCVFGDDLIYPEFKCKDRISVENDQPFADPIQYVLPLNGTYFQIRASGGVEKVGVTIKLNMPEPTRENNIKAGEYYKSLALERIKTLGFTPENYEISYEWTK